MNSLCDPLWQGWLMNNNKTLKESLEHQNVLKPTRNINEM